MKWILLSNEAQLEEIKVNSFIKPQVIFKHSTRCSLSGMARSRLERNELPEDISFYFLDIINYRSISNQISHIFRVGHESPQVLLIRDGICIYNESHSGIDMDEIKTNAGVV
jgi:monothiol bacilliredoxin